jgi:hypothetical protein
MFDLFISHASEDKPAVARPLATELRERGWAVWFDEFELTSGDSFRSSIDRGLAAQYGLVILSPNFFREELAQRELDGLTAREMAHPDRKVILPVWTKSTMDSSRASPLHWRIGTRLSHPLVLQPW